jgi:hypothetical protein
MTSLLRGGSVGMGEVPPILEEYVETRKTRVTSSLFLGGVGSTKCGIGSTTVSIEVEIN